MPRGGSKPGERRGGRVKGTPNRATLDVADKLRKLGCDPIEGMARIAMGVDGDGNPLNPQPSIELTAKMHAELAQYVAPKRKAVEHSGSVGVRHEDAVKDLQAKLRAHDQRG